MKIVTNVFILLLLSSCSQTIAPLEFNEVSLSRTDVSKVIDIPIQSYDIKMDAMLDKRQGSVIATLDGIEVPTSKGKGLEALGQKLTNSISKTFINSGFKINNSSKINLGGYLQKYNVKIQGSFPSEGFAVVQFTLIAKNKGNRASYSANYIGSAKLEVIRAKQEDLNILLDKALESALKQMIKDVNLIDFLRPS